MIFETLKDSAQRGELLLLDGGLCHWHLRQDGQLTIREIISTRPGAGSRMLRRLEHTVGASSLFAKCPAGLPANLWYMRRGFHVDHAEFTKSGKVLICWRKVLSSEHRQPNAGPLEVIFCADGNRRFAEIALDAGWNYGARLPAAGLPFRPYFADQDWKTPDRAAYMALLEKHTPHMATVLDLERYDQLDEVLSWANEAAQYVQVVVIIPKAHGIIAELPTIIDSARVRLGYSVPTRYGGTTVQLHEFAAWQGDGVHLLGGAPQRQMKLYRQLPNVRSVDTNYHKKLATNGQWWTPGTVIHARTPYWPTLRGSDGGGYMGDVPYEAFRRSCANIMTAWRRAVSEPRGILPSEYQMSLWHPRELERVP